MPKKEKTAQEWREAIDNGLRYRREYGMEDAWASIEATFYNADTDAREAAGPNIIASTGDSFLSALSVSYPYLNVKPRRPEYIKNSPVLESVDNWLLKEIELDDAVERAVTHAFLWGVGMLKIGYDSEFGYDPEKDIGENQPLGMTLTQFDKKGNLIESGITDPGMPWVMPVLPHDIVVPYGTIKIKDAPWIAHRFIRHIDDIKADPKYSNHRDLVPQISTEDYTKSYTKTRQLHRIGESRVRTSGSGSAEYVECFEIHNRRNRRIYVIATGHDRIIRKSVNHLQLDGLPFIPIAFTPRARTFWTTPDAYYLRQPQCEMDDISLQASKQRRASVLKFLYEEDTIDETELDKITSGDVGIGAKVNAGKSIGDAIHFLHNENQSALYQDAEVIRRNAREVTGLSRNQAGEFQGGRTTAKEVAVVDRAALSRMGRRQKILRTTYEKTFRKINQIIFRYWTQERVAEYVGEEGASEWQNYTGSSLRGEYQYEVVFSDEILPTESAEKNEALQLYMNLAQDPSIDPLALREYLADSNNNPAFKKLFKQNANVQTQVPGLPGGAGDLSLGQGQG